jgi:hypothetical protein
VGRLSEEAITPPAWWTLSEVEEYLLERARRAHVSEAEREEGSPCWWMLSALDRCEGKEAREAYYAGL